MRALVTGGTGFVGAALVRALLADGHDVRCLVRPGADQQNLADLDVDMAPGDLLDRGSLLRALRGVDALFHVAAAYSLWSKDPGVLYRTNVEGTRAVMEAALQRGIRDVVYTSSVAVLAPPRPGAPPSDETSSPARLGDVVGHYKRSKVLAEQVVRDLIRERGLQARIVLPATPIGAGDLKPTPTGKIVVDFLCGRMPAYLDTGLNVVCVEDVARGHLLALRRGRPGERYILGNENLTLRQILETLADLTGLPAPKVRIPYALAWTAGACSTALARISGRAPAVPLEGVRMAKKRMWFDPQKARAELAFPTTPARDALRRAALWYCERPGYVPDAIRAPILARLAAGDSALAPPPAPESTGASSREGAKLAKTAVV